MKKSFNAFGSSIPSTENDNLLFAYCVIFFGIRNLSGLNDLYSLISPKNLLTLMFPSALTLFIHFSSTLSIYFWHSFSWRLWRAGILLLTKFKGQRSNFHYSQFKKARFKNESRFKKDCCYNRFFLVHNSLDLRKIF